MVCHSLCRTLDKAQIGLALTSERCRYANDHGVGLSKPREVADRQESTTLARQLDTSGTDMGNIRPACIELFNLDRINVEAERQEAFFGHRKRQGQLFEAKADH